MRHLLGLLMFVMPMPLSVGEENSALQLPLHPDEAKIVQEITRIQGIPVTVEETPKWLHNAVIKSLEPFGFDGKSLKSLSVAGRDMKNRFLSVFYQADGRVVALSGNGPWLPNDAIRMLAGMPELRIIRIDHNGTLDKTMTDLYDGSGFDALADSKLVQIKIGLSFNDRGMEQVAKIRSLKSFSVAHSRVTDAGVAFFEGHPNLESFSVGEMASGRITAKSLASIAKMPKVTEVGFHEIFIGYDNGLALLAPMRGRLKKLDLSMSLVNDDDLTRLKADHPDLVITRIPPAEIVKRHPFVAANLAKQATGPIAEEMKKAVAEAQPK